jgi:serine/threonine protein phosphatase PrpC
MEIIAHSDTGRVRRNNEDAIAFDVDHAVAILADGMGGLAHGEVASRLAVDAVLAHLTASGKRTEEVLRAAIETANLEVREAGRSQAVDMGTTLVAWMASDRGQCFVAHVGDSRVYRIRDGMIKRLTSDHSVVQQMIDDGVISEAEAVASPSRNVITRALGLEEKVDVEVRSWVYTPQDLFLLCSDGLTDMVGDAELASICDSWGAEGAGSLEVLADALVRSANDAGGHDNVSVLLIRPC